MPGLQIVVERCNAVFRSENIRETVRWRDVFAGEMSVAEIADQMRLAEGDQIPYLDQMPDGMGAALKALIAANLLRPNPYGMQFLWFEGAEWEFVISEVAPTGRPSSRGNISVVLRSPKL
jgi:hypothetical protein